MPSAEEIRNTQRTTWAGLSAGWEKWDQVIMDQLAPVGTAMIDRLGIADAQQHLDVAAGTGEPGLSIARRSPDGRVVLTDLVAEMLVIAARRADAQGVTNIETKVCSADDLPFDDAIFDSISVRFGYMFFPNAAKATQYWEMISEHVSFAVAALHQVDGRARARIQATVISNVSDYENEGKVRVPGVAR